MLTDAENSKTNSCAENVYRIWNENKDKSSTQLVFCDLSTPKSLGTEDNPYEMELVNGIRQLKERQFTDVYTSKIKKKQNAKEISANNIANIDRK